MKRVLIIVLTLAALVVALYSFNHYWIHRYDPLIEREAASHHLDRDLVWSIVYEETYFRQWKKGRDGEIGLMQVTPTVARAWASETNARDQSQVSSDAAGFLMDPQHNIRIGCWYLEKFDQEYRDTLGREARMVAAYNAGPSRAADWSRPTPGGRPQTEDEFIARIDIPSTKAYVISILSRYRKIKSSQ
jgi:soluble lytic murein transglycosylase